MRERTSGTCSRPARSVISRTVRWAIAERGAFGSKSCSSSSSSECRLTNRRIAFTFIFSAARPRMARPSSWIRPSVSAAATSFSGRWNDGSLVRSRASYETSRFCGQRTMGWKARSSPASARENRSERPP